MEAQEHPDTVLTIGIPTFNRCGALTALLEQVESETPDGAPVEILVSSNASTDETEQAVHGAAARSRHRYTYHRNADNVGFDGNILEVYRRAKGRYVWFLADDDTIEPGGVRALLAALQGQADCGLVINNVRHGIRDGAQADLVPYSPTGIRMRMRVGHRAAVTNEQERLTVVLGASQISSCVVRKYDEPFPDGPGGGHMQERLANLSLLRTPFYFMTAEPVIRGGPSWWTFWFMEAVMFGIRRLYAEPDMRVSQALSDLVATQTCKVGLYLLTQRHRRAIPISFPEIDDALVARLKEAYGDAYAMLDPSVRKALRAARHPRRDRFLFLAISPFYYGWRVLELIVLPRLRFQVGAFRRAINAGNWSKRCRRTPTAPPPA